MQKRLLVINFGGLGDQVLFFPVLEHFRDCFITLVTEPRSKAAGELTDLIDEIFISNLKNNIFDGFSLLIKAYSGRYDAVISSGSSKFIPALLFLTGIRERIGYNTGILSRLLLTKAGRLNKNQYAANMYHDLISISSETKIPEIKICPKNKPSVQKRIVIHPGVSSLSIKKGIIKHWPIKNWITLAKMLINEGYQVALTGGPDDSEALSELEKRFPDNIVKTGGIGEFANLVNSSDMLVCVDSAPMHIGVGLRKPVVALFGPTDEKKLLPEYPLFIPVKNDALSCRPCLWARRASSCKNPDCLNIKPDYVLGIITSVLKRQ